MGSIGLFVFALVIHETIRQYSLWVVIGGATVLWLVVSVLVWYIRKRMRRSHKHGWYVAVHGPR
jgi:hypothetical protein